MQLRSGCYGKNLTSLALLSGTPCPRQHFKTPKQSLHCVPRNTQTRADSETGSVADRYYSHKAQRATLKQGPLKAWREWW